MVRLIQNAFIGVAMATIVVGATVFAVAVLLWFWQQGTSRSFAAMRTYASTVTAGLR